MNAEATTTKLRCSWFTSLSPSSMSSLLTPLHST